MTRLETAPDALLAERSADGDTAAFAVLVRRHAPFLRAFAARLTGSMADADDCVQEALITVWDKLPELHEPERVRAWLTTIVSRKATDRLRARRPSDRIDDLELEDPESSPERQAIASSRLDALRAALDALTPEQRAVWLLKEVGEHSYEEIADQLEVPVATVRGRLARARASVLQNMEEWR
ncbi:RNA polymerase sigma factor [Microbacterium sp. CJ88]|uniref:RNA polymerase sigma factor n=1 Tax=Microbacterium sp. CJ88 TaxID=3445672 RepID=UPI003F65AB01